jgi:pyruvate/2-oxoglutarate dehydrogenase complex dihydrolipoamide acyltransferase (E2) component
MKLKMYKLNGKELGSFRLDLLSMLSKSADPFVSVMYSIDIGPCRELARAVSAQAGKRITLTHVINKLIAVSIAENPVYNQVVLDGSLYQMEGIHIANTFLLPGDEQAVTYIVLSDPHLKSLAKIQEDLQDLQENKISEYGKKRKPAVPMLLRLCFKTGLYRLVSEKLAFCTGFQKGLTSNIVLSNHVYSSPANYIVLKPIIAPMKTALRIHSCGTVKQPAFKNGVLIDKEIMPLHVTTDHRIIHGVHGHAFGMTLERIASDPSKYLL